jgi:hypothetical protein
MVPYTPHKYNIEDVKWNHYSYEIELKVGRATPKKRPQVNNSKDDKSQDPNKRNKTVIITILVAVAAIFIPLAYDYFKNLPSPNLSVAVYGGNIIPIINKNDTAIVGLKPIFPAIITNTGNVPVHIASYELYENINGKPYNITVVPFSEKAYLKPQETLKYNFTKTFGYSYSGVNMTLSYWLGVTYWTQNFGDNKTVWFNKVQDINLARATNATIDYGLDRSSCSRVVPSEGNIFLIPIPSSIIFNVSKSAGTLAGSIIVSLKFTNATFLNTTATHYFYLNNNQSQVSYFFQLPARAKDFRKVSFNVDKGGVSGFSIEISAIKPSPSELSQYILIGEEKLTYKWIEKDKVWNLN